MNGYDTNKTYSSPAVDSFFFKHDGKGGYDTIITYLCPQWTVFFKHNSNRRYDTINMYPCLTLDGFNSNTIGKRDMVQLICSLISQ